MSKNNGSDSFSLRALLWVMLLSLTIIFAAIVSSYLRYNKTLADYELLNHTSNVMKEITQLKSIIYETESSIRAYLILGDIADKPDLNIKFKEADEQWKLVKSMTADNPEQQVLCDSLLDLIQQRYVVFTSSMAGKVAANDSFLTAGVIRGNRIMDRFTEVINQMMQNEYELNSVRATTTESGTKYTPIFLLLASAISSFFIILVYVLLVREYRKVVSLQRTLARNVRELNQSNKELEQFAYIASHDLQEPLRKMRSFSSILKEREHSNLSAEGHQMLQRINSSAMRMQNLIDDLLTFSRMLTRPPQMEQVDLNKVIEEVKSEMPVDDNGRKVVIESVVLPVINGYSNSLNRLFQNLFSNSVKYAKREGDIIVGVSLSSVKGDVVPKAIESDKRRTFYKITVTDNGIGFENEYAEKIFTIFQRLHNRNEYSGTGIGLAICKRVMENHEGYITASSQPGAGTTIDIYFPAS